MNRTISIFILSLFLTGFQLGKHADFSGSWQLDLSQSTNLPPSFKSVDSYIMTVEQTKDSMKFMVSMKGSGQDVKFPLTSYALNGKETFREDALRQSKRWSKVSWAAAGKRFIVKSRVEQGCDSRMYNQVENWEFKEKDTLQISVTQKFSSGKEPHS